MFVQGRCTRFDKIMGRVGGNHGLDNRSVEAGRYIQEAFPRLREAVNEACKVKGGLVKLDDMVKEIDKKTEEAIRYFR